MRYQNAEKLLPEWLLKEVRRYAAGQMLYIPEAAACRRRRETPYRKELTERNCRILQDRAAGCPVRALAEKYYLSEKSIERILRTNKPKKG